MKIIHILKYYYIISIHPCLRQKNYSLTLEWIVGSRRGVSPLRSHRTVREPLDSYGSSCSVTNIKELYGCTKAQ